LSPQQTLTYDIQHTDSWFLWQFLWQPISHASQLLFQEARWPEVRRSFQIPSASRTAKGPRACQNGHRERVLKLSRQWLPQQCRRRSFIR